MKKKSPYEINELLRAYLKKIMVIKKDKKEAINDWVVIVFFFFCVETFDIWVANNII